MRPTRFYVYIAASLRRTLYTGTTRDISTRMQQHKAARVAGFSAKYRTNRLVWCEVAESCGAAREREAQIKRWRRSKKTQSHRERESLLDGPFRPSGVEVTWRRNVMLVEVPPLRSGNPPFRGDRLYPSPHQQCTLSSRPSQTDLAENVPSAPHRRAAAGPAITKSPRKTWRHPLLVDYRPVGVQAGNYLARLRRALLDRVGFQLNADSGRIGNNEVAVPIVLRHP